MGNSAPQRDARSLREILSGLNRIEQHRVAAEWAKANNRTIDLFGEFARERHLIIFQSGNECEKSTATAQLLYEHYNRFIIE